MSDKETTKVDKMFNGLLCNKNHVIESNIYYLAFNYRGDVNVAVVTANQLANELLGNTDDILEFKLDFEQEKEQKESQFYTDRFFIVDQKYVVEFSPRDQHCFNLYKCSEEEKIDGTVEWYGEELVAEDIPWVCIKIEDCNGNELYNLTKTV